jgi:bifunctional pyridoxal-dependent enzyme with beta-cystathionase and maltose regulon repressor activities
MSGSTSPQFDDLALDGLRCRRSEKWTKFPADVLPAAVAEMDFPLAGAVRARLTDAFALGDCGYARTSTTLPRRTPRSPVIDSTGGWTRPVSCQ